MHGGGGADALEELDRLGVFGAIAVEQGQPEGGGLVVGVFVEGALVKFDGALVLGLIFGVLTLFEVFFCRSFVNGGHGEFAHSSR